MPAPRPMRIAAPASTKPAAGVIATRPATAPAAAPRTLGLPLCSQLMGIQVRAAMPVAGLVTTQAVTARPLAPRALPALKPNQPNHNNAAPNTDIVAS